MQITESNLSCAQSLAGGSKRKKRVLVFRRTLMINSRAVSGKWRDLKVFASHHGRGQEINTHRSARIADPYNGSPPGAAARIEQKGDTAASVMRGVSAGHEIRAKYHLASIHAQWARSLPIPEPAPRIVGQ